MKSESGSIQITHYSARVCVLSQAFENGLYPRRSSKDGGLWKHIGMIWL